MDEGTRDESVTFAEEKMLSLFAVISGESLVTIDPMTNETVAVGRDATLQCVVKHLQDYKVVSH